MSKGKVSENWRVMRNRVFCPFAKYTHETEAFTENTCRAFSMLTPGKQQLYLLYRTMDEFAGTNVIVHLFIIFLNSA